MGLCSVPIRNGHHLTSLKIEHIPKVEVKATVDGDLVSSATILCADRKV